MDIRCRLEEGTWGYWIPRPTKPPLLDGSIKSPLSREEQIEELLRIREEEMFKYGRL